MPSPDPLQHHGGDGPPGLLDFSSNVSPLGVPEAVATAVRLADLTRYPDPTAREVCRAYASTFGFDPEGVVFGAGAARLLWDLAQLLVQPGEAVVTIEPTFSEFRRAVEARGARIVEWRARPDEEFTVDLEAVAARARKCSAAAVYLCNPCNPTARAITAEQIAAFAAELGARPLILDEAYLDLSELWADQYTPLPENVVRVRSLTKELALPGLRVAYLATTGELARRLEGARPPWSTSAPAQAAALAALELGSEQERRRERLLELRGTLARGVAALGLRVHPSVTGWVLVALPEGSLAHQWQSILHTQGVHVRDCTSFGLPGHLRLGARPTSEMEVLLAALAAARRELSTHASNPCDLP